MGILVKEKKEKFQVMLFIKIILFLKNHIVEKMMPWYCWGIVQSGSSEVVWEKVPLDWWRLLDIKFLHLWAK